MKRWAANILRGLSLMISIAMCGLWLRSYWQSDAVKSRTRLKPDRPIMLRTITLYSGRGCIEVATALDHVYMPQNSMLPLGMSYITEASPEHPGNGVINLGWRRAFGGFGIVKDWQTKPPVSMSMAALPYLGPLLTTAPIGWTESLRAVWVPHWLVALAFALWPGRSIFMEHQRRKRKARGLCEKCGYDLRQTVERCPECGRLKPAPQTHEGRANSASTSAS